jgi:hypothetical protein
MPQEYFGEEIDVALQNWLMDEFKAVLHRKYGEDAEVGVVILDPAASYSWQNRIAGDYISCGNADDPRYSELVENVEHKLRFVLRTGLNSSEATIRPDLVEPGDFPYEGAGFYRGYCGGASGLNEETDWWVFRRTVDKLIELRSAAAAPAIAASKGRVPGMKFMEGTLPTA